ncbi:ribonuclease H1 [Denticeps clupeoides]|uniref:Ribonuclease H1 n=1 Tax=Denticeps clupeoides TaxID=299321 RepID=A0AAY4B4E4_9TELE|nr:ribonuclease H1 [Denticeps clupeoides]
MRRLPALYSVVRRAVCCAADDMGRNGGKFFYAVKKGHQPGVYNTWEECKTQVDRFPCASYKKFALEEDAWAFVRSQTSAGLSAPEPASHLEALPTRRVPSYEETMAATRIRKRPCEDGEEATAKRIKPQDGSTAARAADTLTYMGDAVVVYTDGCCSGNGKNGARAGIGVYWGPHHPLNVAERLPGRQTNQRAEIQAACRALEQARDMDIKKLVVYTDSKFTINGVTSWVKTWKTNGWRLKSGGTIINKDDFEKLDKLNAELEVVWLHIPGHAGYAGNEEADRLSRDGAAKPLL